MEKIVENVKKFQKEKCEKKWRVDVFPLLLNQVITLISQVITLISQVITLISQVIGIHHAIWIVKRMFCLKKETYLAGTLDFLSFSHSFVQRI